MSGFTVCFHRISGMKEKGKKKSHEKKQKLMESRKNLADVRQVLIMKELTTQSLSDWYNSLYILILLHCIQYILYIIL